MRRLTLLLACLLLPGMAGAQDQSMGGNFIRYTPPRLISVGSGVFALPGASNELDVYNIGGYGATDSEYLRIYWTGNLATFGTAKTGTGILRGLSLGAATYISGNFMPSTNDARFLGDSTPLSWAHLYLTRSTQGGKTKSLTDAAAAASFVRIAVPTNGFVSGRVIYTATSTDGTNILVSSASCEFAAADTGGTVTAGAPACDTPATAYKRANTLICTISGAVSTTNYDLQATCTDNLAGNQTIMLYYRLDMPYAPLTVTPQ